jgi:proline-specific peptidase
MSEIREGTIPFKGFQVWYRRVGTSAPGKTPLLVLHGGPGAAHSYMKSLDDLAVDGQEVIYYDQIGCGNSPGPADADFYSWALFEDEIDAVRAALGLTQVHIIGQSWGGMLLLDYMVSKKPQGVKSIIISSAMASSPLYESEINRLVSWLPPNAVAAIQKGLKEQKYDDPEFLAASEIYYQRHVLNLDPFPDFVASSFATLNDNLVYIAFQGHCEFMIAGKMKGWDITDRLHEINAPALVMSGSSDEMTAYVVKQVLDRIPGANWHLLPGTHLVHVEQRETYNRLVGEFLKEIR